MSSQDKDSLDDFLELEDIDSDNTVDNLLASNKSEDSSDDFFDIDDDEIKDNNEDKDDDLDNFFDLNNDDFDLDEDNEDDIVTEKKPIKVKKNDITYEKEDDDNFSDDDGDDDFNDNFKFDDEDEDDNINDFKQTNNIIDKDTIELTSIWKDTPSGEKVDIKNLNNNKQIDQNSIMFMKDWAKFLLLEKLFNLIAKDRSKLVERATLNSDLFKWFKLESFVEYNLWIKKFPHSAYIDFWWVTLEDDKKINEQDASKVFWQILWWEKVKNSFFWKWKFYVLSPIFLNSDYMLNIVKRIVAWWDKETILIWYDLLDNKFIFSTIEELRHYQVLWWSWSWKTVALVEIVSQYLMKKNTKVIFLEKWTDLDWMFVSCSDMLYKADVENLKYDSIIAIFTYLAMEMNLRRQKFTDTNVKKIQDYNKLWKDYMPYILFVIDEFARLRSKLSKIEDEFFTKNLSGILAVARSYWIYLMFSTQNPQAESWIPTTIQGNLSTKITGYVQAASSITYLDWSDERRVARLWRVVQWDFLFKSESVWSTVMRTYFVWNNHVENLINEWYLNWRPEEERKQITDINNYSNELVEKEIRILIWELSWLEDILGLSRFKKYWISESLVESIIGIKKIAIILSINIILNWFENDVAKKIRETNLLPSPFNIINQVDILSSSPKYEPLWFLFMLAIKLYDQFFSEGIKNIKFNKKQIEWWKDWELIESRETFLDQVVESIAYIIDDWIKKLNNV